MPLENYIQNEPINEDSPKKNYSLTIILIVLILLSGLYLGYVLYTSSQENTKDNKLESTSSQESATQPAPIVIQSDNNISTTNNQPTYTAAQVAEKNTKSNCWTIIENRVYDITNYIPSHPGGEDEILQICGKDGSKLFAKPLEHKENDASKFLGKLYLGNLAK